MRSAQPIPEPGIFVDVPLPGRREVVVVGGELAVAVEPEFVRQRPVFRGWLGEHHDGSRSFRWRALARYTVVVIVVVVIRRARGSFHLLAIACICWQLLAIVCRCRRRRVFRPGACAFVPLLDTQVGSPIHPIP